MKLKAFFTGDAKVERRLAIQLAISAAVMVCFYIVDKVMFEPKRREWPSEILAVVFLFFWLLVSAAGILLCMILAKKLFTVILCNLVFFCSYFLPIALPIGVLGPMDKRTWMFFVAFAVSALAGFLLPLAERRLTRERGRRGRTKL